MIRMSPIILCVDWILQEGFHPTWSSRDATRTSPYELHTHTHLVYPPVIAIVTPTSIMAQSTHASGHVKSVFRGSQSIVKSKHFRSSGRGSVSFAWSLSCHSFGDSLSGPCGHCWVSSRGVMWLVGCTTSADNVVKLFFATGCPKSHSLSCIMNFKETVWFFKKKFPLKSAIKLHYWCPTLLEWVRFLENDILVKELDKIAARHEVLKIIKFSENCTI